MSMKKNIAILILLSLYGVTNLSAQIDSGKKAIEEGTILHCWCWSFKTIEKHMETIASAGFTAIQTSPANTCLVGENGGLEFMSKNGKGKWYYHYQPTDWKIGNYQLGTKSDFISMCNSAKRHNIKVIVDVVPNHTTSHVESIEKDFINAVGGMDKMYHKYADHTIRSFNNRKEVVLAKLSGLPDMNTENKKYQEYFLDYMNDLIECGADGFRFDTAKHIGLPDDPKDDEESENDFWLVFTGKKSVNGKKLKSSESLFLYGEVLQEGDSREEAYSKYLWVTASKYGKLLRSALKGKNLNAKGMVNFRNDANPKLVTWIESHDTYANEGESAYMTNFSLRAGYAVIAARKDGTPLFFSRPKGPESVQFPGESKVGDEGNKEYCSEEVRALNHFRTEMKGERDQFINGKKKSVLAIKRGEKGIVIINLGSKETEEEFPISREKGIISDKAHGIQAKCDGKKLRVKIPPETIAVFY